jgi:hypothetical protein
MILDLEFKLLVGLIRFNNIETGFWSLHDGEQSWRIVDIPNDLKYEGIKIAAIARILDDEISIYATALNIKIVEYKILD